MSYHFKILTIDPGNNIGISIMTIDVLTLDIVNIETRLYVLDNLVKEEELLIYDKLVYKLNYIHKIINTLLIEHDPLCVGMETAFLNTKFPKAIMQLSQYTAIIEHSVYLYNSRIKLFKYMPRYIKKYVGASGNADKNDMRNTVNTIPEITNLINTVVLSEHEIDAIAIGYVVLQELRLYPFILYAL